MIRDGTAPSLHVAPLRSIMNMPNSGGLIAATLIPGDGIGPEITDAVVAIPRRWGRPSPGTSSRRHGAIAAAGDPLPPSLLDSIRRTRLRSATAGYAHRWGLSIGERPLREEFNLYANLRPARR
jgi:isocitrate dehydrogenase (NAD+)